MRRMGGLTTTGTCTPPLVWYQQQQQQPHHLFFLHHLPESSRCLRRRQQPIPIRCAAPANERQALFNRISPVYDNLNDLFSLGATPNLETNGCFLDRSGNSVLDLCCGSGDLAFLLSEKVGFEGQVIGLDFSTQQLLVASSRKDMCFKTCYNNIVWVQGDALDLPYPDNRFDAITVGYGLRNVVDKPKAMKEIFRVLKPGSKASILDFNKSTEPFVTSLQEWMIDNVAIPVASSYGLAKEYEYLKSSIREFLTGKELEKLALETGFFSAKHYEIGGLMGNLVVKR